MIPMSYEQGVRMSPLIPSSVRNRKKLVPKESIPTIYIDDSNIRYDSMMRMIQFMKKNRHEAYMYVAGLEMDNILNLFELTRVLQNMMALYTIYKVLRFEKTILSTFFDAAFHKTVPNIEDHESYRLWKSQVCDRTIDMFCNYLKKNAQAFRIQMYPSFQLLTNINNHEYVWYIQEIVYFGNTKNDCMFPSILPNVLLFDVSNTNRFDLPLLPRCERLFCSNNHLKKLPDLSSCWEIDCSKNNLKTLPDLPNCIILNCSKNRITNLPRLPAVRILECDYNELVSIFNLPRCEVLWCSHNHLTRVPNVVSIIDLDCSYNRIRTTPSEEYPRCSYFDCSNNDICPLPNMPSLFQCYASGNTILPNDPPREKCPIFVDDTVNRII